MNSRKLFLFLGVALLLSVCAPAVSLGQPAAAQNGIEIYQPWAHSAALKHGHSGGAVTGIFMQIHNTTNEGDMLLKASSEAAEEIQIHQTTMSGEVMSMAEVFGIEIPAGGQAELKPGGYHLMLIGLKQDLTAGQSVSLRLVFQNAGEVLVEAEVREP